MGIFILGASPTQALAAHLVLVDRNLHMAKTRLVNYDSPWDLDQIGLKLGTKHVIYQKLATFM